MKALKAMAIAAGLIAFIGCDDDWVMDLEPPYGGYIWRVTNDYGPGISKFNPVDGTHIEGYVVPLDHAYDAAAGGGRVWVGGDKYIEEYDVYSPYIWEVGGDDFGAWASEALTYDGEYLWGASTGYEYPGDYSMEFWRVNPDTHDWELMFVIDVEDVGNYYEILRPVGLAWDGNYLWVLTTPKEAIIQIDPDTGEILRTIPAPCDGPRGLTWDGEALWVNDAKTDRLYRVSPKDGSILGYHEMSPPGRLPPPAPYGLAFEFPSE
jgi:hypothetical protein